MDPLASSDLPSGGHIMTSIATIYRGASCRVFIGTLATRISAERVAEQATVVYC